MYDLKSSSARSYLGIFWITLGFSIFVLFKSFIFSQIFKQNFYDYVIYLSASLGIWFFLSGITVGGCAIYTGNKIQIMMNFPKNFFLFYLYFKKIIELFFQLFVFLFFSIFANQFNIINLFVFLFNLIVLLIFLYPFVMNLAYLSLVSKDFSILIGYLMKVFFFITPVIWSSNMIAEKYHFLFLLNPYYHFLEILRNSLLNNFNFSFHYIFLLIFFFINAMLYLFLSKKFSNYELYIK